MALPVHEESKPDKPQGCTRANTQHRAVRDKEGNALRNSHVIGFFRRICKLLFIGIKPVFVFDGGAPALKRQTINGRKQRREGRREDAVRTAGKLLAVQMQRRAEEEEVRRKEARNRPAQRQEEEALPEEMVYVDELQMTQQERQQSRKFKKKDQYHLPDLDVSMSEMGQPNDPRVMSLEELEQYARQFDSGEDINVYDFSKIDFNSAFFTSLPASDRYNILNAARLRSRLRMGYSKDQLDTMFPDRMAFSRFQIDRVKERNELTQRLMNINGSGDDMFGVDGTTRVAGERGREYVLVKNAGVEGGWALGVIGEKDEGQRNKPIDIEEMEKRAKLENEDDISDEDDGFEDVPIEGLNRLPKRKETERREVSGPVRQRRTQYDSRKRPIQRKPAVPQEPSLGDPDSLFISEDRYLIDEEDLSNDEELQRAIALSLDNGAEVPETEEQQTQRAITMSLGQNAKGSEVDEDEFEEVFGQKDTVNVSETISGSAWDIAKSFNKRSTVAARSGKPFDDSDDEEANIGQIDNVPKSSKTRPSLKSASLATATTLSSAKQAPLARPASKFSGPLPFESLDLGSSVLGKKAKKLVEEDAGGFEKEGIDIEQKNPATFVPPWFSEDASKGVSAQKAIEDEDRRKIRYFEEQEEFEFQAQPKLRTQETSEVIDLDALDEKEPEVIDVDGSDDEESDDEDFNMTVPPSTTVEDRETNMDDLADLTRVEPPRPTESEVNSVVTSSILDVPDVQSDLRIGKKVTLPEEEALEANNSDDEELEWEESDREDNTLAAKVRLQIASHPAGGSLESAHPRSASPEFEFEDVAMNAGPAMQTTKPGQSPDFGETQFPSVDSPARETNSNVFGDEADIEIAPAPLSGDANQYMQMNADREEDQADFSDAEDDELMQQLAVEAEEHARFASSLNHKTPTQNIAEYDRELKALRSQQKKDRRDADEVTHVMVTECQQLLKLFGLPYITAPMEAEAQCAELVSLGLVDGIVTDDSDIFLFGGTRVYKNMFNQAKYVECYLSADLERDFALTREKLIAIAHLLGSDYTEGLAGVGPVSALEILSEFPGGLEEFKAWFTSVQTGVRAAAEDKSSPFRKKFRKQATRLLLPPAFPDKRVDVAYLKPEVDSDPSAFQWGVPDLDALRTFLMATIGWTQERTDEILVPVIRDMNRRENEGTQSNITQFLGSGTTVGAGAFAPRKRPEGKSRRMESALERMAESARSGNAGGRFVHQEPAESAEVPSTSADADESNGDARKRKAKTTSKSVPRKKRVAAQRPAVVESYDETSEFDAADEPYEGEAPAKKGRKVRGKQAA